MTKLNTEFEAAREQGEAHVPGLEQAYLAAIRAVARQAAERFSERATPLTAAANWQPPDVGDVMAFAVSADRIRGNQRQMMGAIGGRLTDIPGVSFDALAPPSQRQLEKLGLRAVSLSADFRTPVANAIAQAWAEGRSIPQAATMIQQAVNGLAPARATMLARTDLISLSNGANRNVVTILNDAAKEVGDPPPILSKTWLSSQDGRVRPTHQDADGQTIPVDQPYSVGGFDLMYPGDPDGPDEEVIQCRCTELFSEEAANATDERIPEGADVPAETAGGFPWATVRSLYDSGNVLEGQKVILKHVERSRAMSAVETEAPVATRWISDVAFEGVSTGDGRYMVPGSLGWRDLPLTLMAMIETPEFGGHAGAQVAGRMDTLTKDSEHYMTGDPLPEGVTALRSTGEFDIEGERGGDTARMVEDETMRGVSIDLAVMEWALRDPETGDLIDPEEASDEDWERAFMGDLEFAVVQGEIMAATVCPTPAFAEARIAILAAARVRPNVWKANAYAAFLLGVEEGQMMTTLTASIEVVKEPVVAAARRHATARRDAAPIAPPVAWLHRPEPKEPTPWTIEESGECYGHLALWETCHTGYLNGEFAQCVRAPHSITSYGQYHVGELRCEKGDLVPIGKITFDTGHADLSRTRAAARCHYDDTGAVGAFVRARDGEFGIWVSGVLRNDITPEGVRDLRANPLSGDWRDFERNLELIAALAVPVPGFPIARSQLALSASADGDVRITALILTGLGLTAAVSNGNHEHEGAALDAIIAGGAAGLAELIG